MSNAKFWAGIASLFLFVAWILYYPAISGGWFMDDYHAIVLKHSIKNFSTSLNAMFSMRGISYLSFAVDYSIWGLNPVFSRIVNVGLHLCSALLVVALCREIVGKARSGVAVFVGLMFLCHPLQTSAVNYIVQRMTLLSSLFALCSLLLLCKYFNETGSGRRRALILCCALFAAALSMFSKENTVLLPCLVPLVAWVIGKGCMRRRWLFATVAYAAVSLALVMVYLPPVSQLLEEASGSIVMEEASGSILPEEASGAKLPEAASVAKRLNKASSALFFEDTGTGFYTALNDHDYLPIRYLLSQGEVFWTYLRLIFLPFEQALDYCWPIPGLESWPLPVFTFVLIVGAWAAVFKKRNQYPLSFFGFHWVLFLTAVESSIIPLDPIFEHRMYLLMFGICLIVVEQMTTRIANKKVLTVVAFIALAFYSSLSWNRNAVWGGSELDFWKSNSAVVARAPRPQFGLAKAYFKKGEFAEAAKAFRSPLAYEAPGILRATGEALYFAGKQKEAFELFSRLGEQTPGENSLDVFSAYAAAKDGQWRLMEEFLGKARLRDSGDIRIFWLQATIATEKRDNLNAAIYSQQIIADWERKVTIDPFSLNAVGYVEWARNLRKQSLSHLSGWLAEQGRLISESPNDVKLKAEFGGYLMQLGLYDQAREYYKSAAQLAPKAWSLYYNLGIISDKQNDIESSFGYYEKALALSPGNMLVLENLAASAYVQRKYRIAEGLYKEIVVKSPLNGKAWLGLGATLEKMRNYSEAKLSYERASRLPNHSLQAELMLKKLADKTSGFL